MKTVSCIALLWLLCQSGTFCQTYILNKQQRPAASNVTVRVLDAETFRPVNAKIIIVSQNVDNQIDPIFEDRVYKYRIAGNDTATFSIFAEGYETLNEPVRVSEINGTEVFYLIPKPGRREVKAETTPVILPDEIVSVLYFRQSSTEMSPRSQRELERITSYLTTKHTRRVELSGHTDNVGDAEKNMTLSVERAALVRQYLMGATSPSAGIRTRAYGSARPAAPNDCERNRRFNRRVEVKIEPVL